MCSATTPIVRACQVSVLWKVVVVALLDERSDTCCAKSARALSAITCALLE